MHNPLDESRSGGKSGRLPLLIYDGDCGFCRLWIERWKTLTGERVEYRPYQEVASRFPEIPTDNLAKSAQLVTPDGRVFAAAHAVFRTLAYAPGRGWMLWMYQKIPGVAAASEAGYRLVAAHRSFLFRLTRWLWGGSLAPASHVLTRRLFLGLLGVIYLIAFSSLSTQILGLAGSRGILPAAEFLQAVKDNVSPDRYWLFPTLAWLNSSDTFLRVLTLGGVLLSLLLMAGVATVPVLIILWAAYLSLVIAGQDFMMFQWDGLLLETGFLAIFFAPWQLLPNLRREREPSRAVLWLLRFLAFRLMFSSGVAKLLSGDPRWRKLTALDYHYETQPLPTPVAWYAHQLPQDFQKISVAIMFFIEILVPFLIFAPRRLRFLAAGALIFLQVLMALTGNYTFFNWLAVALCLLLFDDALLERSLPQRFGARMGRSHERPRGTIPRRALTACFAAAILFAGLVEIPGVRFGARLPRPAARVLTSMRVLRMVNGYGLFAIMTTARFEIVIEGSNDGERWSAYEFKYKPGDVNRAPGWVAPYQPRLDWQMWFAALGNYQENPWFTSLMLRLLQGSPEVLALLASNPFPEAPPHYLRASFYEYHFTDFPTRRATGAWWRRKPKGLYFPVVRLP
jgi:predicted DCC family thiol-disulfide oxidoreductase YuxK